MKKKYDFSKAKKAKPAKEVKVSKTIRLDIEVIQWLEEQGEKEGMGYQTFLNWFLQKQIKQNQTLEQRVGALEKHISKKEKK